jgi:hypothetical protein
MKVISSNTIDFRAMVITGIMALLLIMAGGCSKSPPGCDDGKTVKAVVNTISEDFRKSLSGIAGMGGPGMELSEDEWKTIRSGMVIDLENIREQSFDEATGKRTCAADLMVVQGGKKELTPITYVPEISKETGELKISLSGLDKYEKAKQPAPLPE